MALKAGGCQQLLSADDPAETGDDCPVVGSETDSVHATSGPLCMHVHSCTMHGHGMDMSMLETNIIKAAAVFNLIAIEGPHAASSSLTAVYGMPCT